MGKIKADIDIRKFDDRKEIINSETKEILKTKFIPRNVQVFKKNVKETGNLGV